MGTYKVLQDIEAEDKLLGPLTLKQFIFAIITAVFMFIAFLFAKVNIVLATPWLIPILFFGFMASPIGRDQPNDVWLAARIRFLIKPRKRHWDQSGMVELVTITAPKKAEIIRTNGLDQTQVSSRLKALSATMDSRGWAVKNLGTSPIDSFTQGGVAPNSDRLFDITTTEEVPDVDIRATDDILDPVSNMVAHRFDTGLKEQHEDTLSKLKDIASGKIPPAANIDYSFITAPIVDPGYTSFGAQVVGPASKSTGSDSFIDEPAIQTTEEANFLSSRHASEELNSQLASNGHGRVITPIEPHTNPISEQASKLNPPAINTSTGKAPDDILEKLGQSSDELKVASIASLATHAQGQAAMQQDEVVSLH